MSASPENPPAFPNPEMGKAHFDDVSSYSGMTLRDWFAGQALAGMLADTAVNGEPDAIAKCCYSQADAMLLARSQTLNAPKAP